jgi:hypothetical protein
MKPAAHRPTMGATHDDRGRCSVATAVLVVTSSSVSLTDHSARRLAEIGVTRITLLGDREGTAVVLEGWAFDPCRSVAEAVAALRVGNAAGC